MLGRLFACMVGERMKCRKGFSRAASTTLQNIFKKTGNISIDRCRVRQREVGVSHKLGQSRVGMVKKWHFHNALTVLKYEEKYKYGSLEETFGRNLFF